MAKRTSNRLQKRIEVEEAARREAAPAGPGPQAAPKPGAKPRAKRPSRKKPPPRLRARWGVFDQGMKQVAIFDYNQRVAAEEKVAALNGRKGGEHFLQIVKEPMPEPAAEDPAPTRAGGVKK